MIPFPPCCSIPIIVNTTQTKKGSVVFTLA